MKVAGLQWNLAWEDREANYDHARELVPADADLIVLPEMFSSGFSMDVAKVAEEEPSRTEEFLRELARDRDAAVMGGIVRSGEAKGRNELISFSPDGTELVSYQKIRTFRYTQESDHYENGSQVKNFEWQGWNICPFICYDLRFPGLFRQGVAKGAELFVVIASWPTPRVEHWLALLRARAIENLAYVIGVNRTGSDPANQYPGRSVIFDPWGETVADAGSEDGAVVAEIDLDRLRGWRTEFPALLDLEI